MRCRLSGAFRAQELGNGAWRLTHCASPEIDVYVRGVQAGAANALRASSVSDLGIEWQSAAVALNFIAHARVRTIEAQSAIIHEPLPGLYDDLPLAGFDNKARRFWRRVFWLARIPGGRSLLRVLARRSHDPR